MDFDFKEYTFNTITHLITCYVTVDFNQDLEDIKNEMPLFYKGKPYVIKSAHLLWVNNAERRSQYSLTLREMGLHDL